LLKNGCCERVDVILVFMRFSQRAEEEYGDIASGSEKEQVRLDFVPFCPNPSFVVIRVDVKIFEAVDNDSADELLVDHLFNGIAEMHHIMIFEVACIETANRLRTEFLVFLDFVGVTAGGEVGDRCAVLASQFADELASEDNLINFFIAVDAMELSSFETGDVFKYLHHNLFSAKIHTASARKWRIKYFM